MTINELRKHPRVKPPRSVVVAWQSGMKRDVCFVESLGLGGMYVRTRTPVPLRSPVQILLDLPLGQVRARAVVRRVAAEQGMAMQFIAMDPEDRARLHKQMRSLLPSPV